MFWCILKLLALVIPTLPPSSEEQGQEEVAASV